MKLIMTGIDHKLSDLDIREEFAITKEKAEQVILGLKDSGKVNACVIISTCNRTEVYASVTETSNFEPSRALCEALGKEFAKFEPYFEEKADDSVIEHLCSVASGLDSQIMGDDQIITQVREAIDLSRTISCTDSYIETLFNLAIKAAKIIKTNIILRSPGTFSIPGKMVDKLKTMCTLSGKSFVVIGNGQM